MHDITTSNSLADLAARIEQGRDLDYAHHLIRSMALLRSKNASVRSLAKTFDTSRSTIVRWLPVIDAVASLIRDNAEAAP